MTLTHSPNTADRQALEKILDGKATTVPERVVAQSLLDVLHIVSAEDKPKLEAIRRDPFAPRLLGRWQQSSSASITRSLNPRTRSSRSCRDRAKCARVTSDVRSGGHMASRWGKES